MIDHDQRFKTILSLFLGEFFEVFLPDLYEDFDFTHVEFLTNESFPDPTEGERLILDLVAKIRLRDGSGDEIAIIHVEIESKDSVVPLRSRMWKYWATLRIRYDCEVIPIAFFIHVGNDGIGVDVYEEGRGAVQTLTFRCRYVGLPGLNASDYRDGPSVFAAALSVLMRQPRAERPANTIAVVQRVLQSPLTEEQRHLLLGCAIAYGPDDDQRQETDRLIQQAVREKQMTLPVDFYTEWKDFFREQGRQEGREALIEVLTSQLSQRFGSLPPSVRERISKMSFEELKTRVVNPTTIDSLDEFERE